MIEYVSCIAGKYAKIKFSFDFCFSQKLVDPENTFVHILTNEDCDKIVYQPEDMDEYIKDIERLNRDMKRVVYIDS